MSIRRVFILVSVALIVSFGALWVRFEIKLGDIMHSKAVRMHVQEFKPAAPAVKRRLFDLGFARLWLPEDFIVELRRNDEAGWRFSGGETSLGMDVAPPTVHRPTEYQSLNSSMKALKIDAAMASNVDVMSRIVAAEPVSFWELFRYGKAKFAGLITLATLKSVCLSNVGKVIEYQRADYHFLAISRAGVIVIDLSKGSSGLSDYMVIKDVPKREAVYVDSVLTTLEIVGP